MIVEIASSLALPTSGFRVRNRIAPHSKGEGETTLESSFGCMHLSPAALRRLRHELEADEEGVVDEMGVGALHLSLYRLALGQTDQESLVHALQRRIEAAGDDGAAARARLEKTRIHLSPPVRGK